MPQTEKTLTAAEVRRQFLDFFIQKHSHTFVPSSPVVPHDDPTLLFTNAGMNQFKDVFLGQGQRPYTRAVNSQKCIRAGGKHNDLEDVGKDTYHHTFFEMLGNWSFGDYFKREAIQWAWQLLTDVWGLDKSRLYVTVFAGDEEDGLDADEEAARLWAEVTDIDPSHISRWGKKDNFWEMGDTGPCGPCSEVHYDFTPEGNGGDRVNLGDPDVIELWNLVFIQFNRDRSGKLTPLPAQHVDTGMGFERIVRVLQGKSSNYDTDIWTPIFNAIQQKTGAVPYADVAEQQSDIAVAYRVIADHIRCLTVAITDGALPSNEGRGYVLRRILRRAVRHGRQTMGVQQPLLCELVPAVADSLGDAFPELRKDAQRVADVIRSEELAFLQTIDRGIEHFNAAAKGSANEVISADDAFKLHDTYGFPIDLTQVMAEELGMTVDVAGFEKLMEQARQRSRAAGGTEEQVTLTPNAIAELQSQGIEATEDKYKYAPDPVRAQVKAIWNGTTFDDAVGEGQRAAVILDRTSFYAERGGQVGDQGVLTCSDNADSPAAFEVEDTQVVGGYVLHVGRLTKGRLGIGDEVTAIVERDRRAPIQANHTGTHLLNFALREVLGGGVEQKGSLVADDRLRFDFSASRATKLEEIERIEQLVNERIDADLIVDAGEVPLKKAKRITGVRAVFGERYPDPVRVVSIGAAVSELEESPEDPKWRAYSIEFCGGTHLTRTGEAKKFVIVSEQALAAGVRRVTALTGEAAQQAVDAGQAMLDRIAQAEQLESKQLIDAFDGIGSDVEQLTTGAVARRAIAQRLDGLREKVRAARKASQATSRDAVVEQARQIAEQASGQVIVERIDGSDKDLLLVAMDVIKARHSGSAIMLFTAEVEEGKVAIVAAVPKELIGKGLKAGDWVREAARACGGGGGGRPDMAQAGGKQPEKVGEAMEVARAYASERVG